MSTAPPLESDIRDAIIYHPLVVSPMMLVSETLAVMRKARAEDAHATASARASCVIVAEHQELLGIITEQLLLRQAALGQLNPNAAIRSLMVRSLSLCYGEMTTLRQVLDRFEQQGIDYLPVLNDQYHVVGLLTRTRAEQIAMALQRLQQQSVSEVMTTEVQWMPPAASLQAIAQVLDAHPGQVVVASGLAGPRLITGQDVVAGLEASMFGGTPRESLGQPMAVIAGGASLKTARSLMFQQQVCALLVTDDEHHWAGILTYDHIQSALPAPLAMDLPSPGVDASLRLGGDRTILPEELYRLTLSNISDAVFLTDDRGKLIFICPNVDVLFGYSVSEVEAMEDIHQLIGYLSFPADALEKTGELTNIERTVYDKHGNEHSVLINIKRVSMGLGTRLYTCRDISDRRNMQESLRQHEAQYRSLIEHLPVGLIVYDTNQQAIAWNARACEFLDVSPDRLHQPNETWELLRDDRTPLPLSAYPAQYVLSYGTPMNEAVVGVRHAKKNSVMWLLVNAFPYLGDEQQIQQVIVTFSEINHHKQVQEQLRDSEEQFRQLNSQLEQWIEERTSALCRSEERYRSLFENAPIALWEEDFSQVKAYVDALCDRHQITDASQLAHYLDQHPEDLLECARRVCIIDVNQAAVRLCEAIDKKILLSSLCEWFTEVSLLGFKQELLCLYSRNYGVEIENKICTFLGNERNILVHLFAMPEFADDWSWVVVGVVNITERKQAEEALRQSESQKNAIVEAIPDLLTWMDRTGRKISIFNAEKYENYIPVPPNSEHGIWDVFPSDVAMKRLYDIDTVLETRTLQVFEYEIETRNEVRYEEVRIVPCNENEVLAISRDISDRKRTEMALRQSEEFLRSIYEGVEVGIFVVDVDKDNIFRYAGASPAHERMTRIPNHVLIGKTPEEVLSSQDATMVREHYQDCLTQGDRIFYEQELHLNDQLAWWLTNIVPIRDENGRIYRLIGTILNITETKRQQESLRLIMEGTAAATGREFFNSCTRCLADALNVRYALLTEFDPIHDSIIYVRSLWNADQGDHPSTQRFIVADAMVNTLCHEMIRGYPCYYPENLRHQFSSDQIIDGLMAESMFGVPILNSEGKKLGHLAVLDTHPMTDDPLREFIMHIFAARAGVELERQKAEDALQRQIERSLLLNEITQKIRSSLDPLHVYQTTVNLLGQTLQVNRCVMYTFPSCSDDAFPSGLLTPAAEWLTENTSSMSHTSIPYEHNPHGKAVLESDRAIVSYDVCHDPLLTNVLTLCQSLHIQSMVTIRTSCRGIVNGIIGLHQCDRLRSWTEEEISLIESVAAQVGIVIAQSTLLEHEKHQRHELAQANAELAHVTQLKDMFLANMSHELRTPLNAILGLSEGLQRQAFGDLSPAQIRAISVIYKSGKHLLELISDILDLSKVASGTLDLELTPVNIDDLCKSSLIFIHQQAIGKSISIATNIEIPSSYPPALLDQRRMRQVLINLLNNAVKFTPEGGQVSLTATIDMKNPTGYSGLDIEDVQPVLPPCTHTLSISIADTGIGIEDKDMKHLFQPFVQLDSSLSRQYPGTGLGLALVRQMVELHGGQVSVVSEIGKGSCFTVRIPYRMAEVNLPSSQDQNNPAVLTCENNAGISSLSGSAGSESNVSKGNSSYLILIVEDNEASLITFVSYLELQGYRLITACNGQEAIALAQSERPNLIVMDIQMPDVDGLEAIRQIRSTPTGYDIPILALTALAMPEDKENCLATGATLYLTKPVKMKHLCDTIQHLLQELR